MNDAAIGTLPRGVLASARYLVFSGRFISSKSPYRTTGKDAAGELSKRRNAAIWSVAEARQPFKTKNMHQELQIVPFSRNRYVGRSEMSRATDEHCCVLAVIDTTIGK